MRCKLRVDAVAGQHVHCTLFMDGGGGSYASCGTLTFRVGEYQLFGAALGLGCRLTDGALVFEGDERAFVEHFAAAKP